MAACLKKACNKNLKHGLLASDQMPKRRKRHYSKMSLMLLIFVSCCLTLIFKPLHVQAKESYNATSKGENILSNDRQSHQHDEAEININADKTNDNATFKRLQPSGIKIENADADAEEEEDEHSTEVIEMIQPPHTLRHQEHYKQRILLGENKHKHKQQQHLDGSANDDIDGDEEAEVQERELTQYNRNLRYKQIQRALREPIASPAPHHRRHEHHFDKQQRLAKQTELTWPQQQHHLRHQHHQQHQAQEFQQHSQPQLRHLKHEMRKQNITTTKIQQPLPHQRYFDRESSYMYPMDNMVTTEGPHLRHPGSNLHWKSMAYLHNPHNRLYSDEGNNNHRNGEEEEEDIKRFSLSLAVVDGHESEQENVKAKKAKDTLHENIGNNEDDTANYDDAHDNDNDNDYSYEDDGDNKEINKQNNYPAISGYTKTNVKRYTNPLREWQLPSSPSTAYALRSQLAAGHHIRHTPPAHNVDVLKLNSNNENNEDDDYDDTENTEDDTDEESSSSSDESSVDEDENDDDDKEDDKMSNEKWNKIEHEHYRKQLQHQHAMQALRSRRPQNNNAPHTAAAAAITTTTTNANKYSSYPPSSLSAASMYNSAWKKRQTLNEDENDNIYSRYYVPGSVTRKKEEELGSPTAILESRRQYALQQRQNKALASAHHRRIVTEGTCRWPQPRVERIRKDSWKIYTPHCTILHRCADDAGCCPSERQTCAPKRTKNVDLYFFVISLNETQGAIEKLTFANHTECHCVNRSKQRAPEYASSGAKDLMAVNNQIPYLRRATILNCYCPNLFEKILQEDGYCRCDCSSGNMGCDWLKRGMEHFSMNDRKCIIEGRCKLPTCEYGQYIKKHGRCPRREERHLSADGDWPATF